MKSASAAPPAAPPVLLLAAPEIPAPVLRRTIIDRCSCDDLVQRAARAPDAALLLIATAEALPAWLAALDALVGRAMLALVPGADAAALDRLAALGAHWLDRAPADWDAALGWAARVHAREAGWRERLDERRWTERAKGVLMLAQGLGEDAAHRLLRETAMHARLKLAELARGVVAAAEGAEAVNLAGQQRFLSQRLVKLVAQRAAAIEPRRAKTLQDASAARIDANLARLAELAPAGSAAGLAAVRAAWQALQPLLAGKPTAEVLKRADAAAETLLERSEALARAVEAGGAHRSLALVNLCGRQRMLSQRLAKQALLADLLPGEVAVDAALFAACEAGLASLEAAPLTSDAIRALQAEVRAEWLHLVRSLRDAHGREAAAGLARSSEALLDQLDRLTALYQQSLQLVLGH
ncbi:MAG: type IV pili methyl-accepting chemotaxis transducer N-terminal domain-containing protein [Pelomonas sp.]|nr:type IV pili methyl-accepting chemotaxis transducer N-terminal domain-containing protein [Roseateles sp.]